MISILNFLLQPIEALSNKEKFLKAMLSKISLGFHSA